MDFDVQEFPDEAAWLEARRGYVTSSDAPAILGVSTYERHNAFDLWLDKRSGEQRDAGKMRRRFQMGHAIEPLVEQWATEELGAAVMRPAAAPHYLVTSAAVPWGAATPDLIVPAPHLDGVIEVKSAQVQERTAYEESAAFRYAATQCQHSMLVCGARQGWVAVVFGMGLDFRLYPVVRSEALIQILGIMGSRFHEHLHTNTPPGEEFVTASAEVRKAIARVYEQESGEEVALEEEWKAQAERLEEIGAALAAINGEQRTLEKEADEIKSRLQLRLGEATYGRIPGFDKLVKFTMRRGGAENVDTRWERRTLSLVKDTTKKRR